MPTLISARRVNRLSLLGSLNPDMARQGWHRFGGACCGQVGSGSGAAMLGKGCRRQHGASTEAPCCSL
jgi:hypothetical protein